jgi:hypothetical protein
MSNLSKSKYTLRSLEIALLGFKWSATTDATEDDALASDTLSSLVELQADNKATDTTDKRAKRRLDMISQLIKINREILADACIWTANGKSVVFFDTLLNSFENQQLKRFC